MREVIVPTPPMRVQLSRVKGWKMPRNTLKVDRSTRWGNPAVVGATWEGEQVEDAQHARTIFDDGVRCACEPFPALADIRAALRGKNLACWCKPGQPCHADVLLELANQPTEEAGHG